ncbi:uncharacterized protein [Rutidosis leptorrhynchoides]|uniref:uncharacterized protein n=1 Tax=Rutidosis leptorrhynchoides TaxID=125765 RepID=UPI003A99D2FF
MDGDENSKYFHSLLKYRRSKQNINGLSLNGVWVEDPLIIKNAFKEFYGMKFARDPCNIDAPSFRSTASLTDAYNISLQAEVTEVEIRQAVWCFGSDKSPGPDGFIFFFIKKYWEILKVDLVVSIQAAFRDSILPFGANSAFICLIPKILNPSCITDYRPISLIGVQYKIITKILANRMAVVIDKIISNVQSAFIKGRQILYGALMEKVDQGVIKGTRIDGSDLNISHLFYADDAVIISEWDKGSLLNTIQVLNDFYRYSGLKINVAKSFLFGLGIQDSVLDDYIHDFGLSGWKVNMLSIGSRYTLLKAVLGSLGIYYLSLFKCPDGIIKELEGLRSNFFWGSNDTNKKLHWIKWNQALNTFENGGLDIESLYAFNIGLMYKWIWRFMVFPNLLWVRLLKAVNGNHSIFDASSIRNRGIWKNIVSSFCKSRGNGQLPSDVLCYKSWNREDIGPKNTDLLQNLIDQLGSRVLSDVSDNWTWEFSEDSVYSISGTILHIDGIYLPSSDPSTLWMKVLPRKINIFVSRLARDRLPTRLNISHRGIEIEHLNYDSCSVHVESLKHVLFECPIATELWRSISRWIDKDLQHIYDWSSFIVWFEAWNESVDIKTK